MFNWFKKKKSAEIIEEEDDFDKKYLAHITPQNGRWQPPERDVKKEVFERNFSHLVNDSIKKSFMDDGINTALTGGLAGGVPDAIYDWYGSQTMIGYTACMVLGKHPIINAACEVPVKDSLMNGWELSVAEGEKEIDTKVFRELKKVDKRFKLHSKLLEFGTFARMFGIRIAIFVTESDDPRYYELPYNPDGVTKGSYKGIVMPDPIHVVPSMLANNYDPTDLMFMEPEFWIIKGKKYHHSHLVILRPYPVAQILKPTYYFGGVSIPERVYEIVYMAVQAANEANRLLMTKRLILVKDDIEAAMANPAKTEDRFNHMAYNRDNHGVMLMSIDADIQQLETSLGEVAPIIAQRYEQVAMMIGIPAVKLIKNKPQGFGSNGEYENKDYNTIITSMHPEYFEPLLNGHYERAIRSLEIDPFEFAIKWNPVDTPTAAEQANINAIKTNTAKTLSDTGAIDGQDVRDMIIADKNSDFTSLSHDKPPDAQKVSGGGGKWGG